MSQPDKADGASTMTSPTYFSSQLKRLKEMSGTIVKNEMKRIDGSSVELEIQLESSERVSREGLKRQAEPRRTKDWMRGRRHSESSSTTGRGDRGTNAKFQQEPRQTTLVGITTKWRFILFRPDPLSIGRQQRTRQPSTYVPSSIFATLLGTPLPPPS